MFFSLFFNIYIFSPSVSSIVIWLHQLSISHHAGFAPVFARYHTNTKMLLSDALIFQASQLGSLCWIPQWLLIKMPKQTNTHRGHGDHMWARNSKVRSQLWDIEHQRFGVSPGRLLHIYRYFTWKYLFEQKKKKKKKAMRKHFIMISEDDRIYFTISSCLETVQWASGPSVTCSWACQQTIGGTKSSFSSGGEGCSLSRPQLMLCKKNLTAG